METIKCSEVRVRDKHRRQILRWRRPMLGVIIVQSEGRRVLIQRKGLLVSPKTYLCSGNETVETYKKWWEVLL